MKKYLVALTEEEMEYCLQGIGCALSELPGSYLNDEEKVLKRLTKRFKEAREKKNGHRTDKSTQS